jgi:hypothetical protein
MRQDIFGQETTSLSEEGMAAWNATMMAFMAHGADTPTHLSRTLELAPNFALGLATKGLFYLLLGRRELVAVAEEALATAQAAVAETSPTAREKHYVEALAGWVGGAPSRSIVALEAALAQHPGDALAAKLSHAVRFVIGDAKGMRRSIERVLPAYTKDNPAWGYMQGCHAFALEETGEFARAEVVGCSGLDHRADDAWGLHAVAHVYDMTANAKAGIEWLNGREAAWAHCNNFRYHVWWHKALMHLDQGQYDTVLDLYDTEIRAEHSDDYRDISNATSLLSRLELEGVSVGDRWEELADVSMTRTEDGCLIFADLHYLLALVGGNREEALGRMMQRLYRDAQRKGNEIEARMAEPGMATAAGLEAFGEADYAGAFSNLKSAYGDLQKAGGSHAQRDVFERLTIDSGIRAGFLDEAEAFLAARAAKRGGAEDRYAIARRTMIAEGKRIPAE